MNNPGRNDPCHCGSGKKYKKCCLPREQPTRISDPRREESFIAELRPDLDEAVDRALQRLARGEGKQVESEIAELLEDNPDYHMTNYAMGVYQAVVAKKPAAAIPFFERAVAVFPPFAEAHFNLGNAARQAFDISKAVDAYRAAERYSQDDGIAEMARKDGLEQARVSKAFANAVLLAVSCREAGCVLVTDNERDFARIRRFVQFEFVGSWPMPAT